MLDSRKNDRRSVFQLAVEDESPREEMALDCSDTQIGEVDEVPLRALNREGVSEDDAIMGLHHFEDDVPQPSLSPAAKVIVSGCSRSTLVT